MKKFGFFLVLLVPAIIFTSFEFGLARAEDNENIDEVEVENEDPVTAVEEDPEEEIAKTTASPDADTTILFTIPLHNQLSTLELPAGKVVEFLVGFTNKGEKDFILDSLDASFRYAMDFNFHIQNFSTFTFETPVKPQHEITLAYSFIPSEAFAGRPFGLHVNLNYRDMDGLSFSDAVFNETVQVIELDEGLDGETVFLYVFLAACVILTLVGGQQLLSSLGRKSRSSTTRKAPVEMGTSNPHNVDYDWLPKDTLNRINKSPRVPKQSPRQRKAKRNAGSDD